jgi:hypothetical protein
MKPTMNTKLLRILSSTVFFLGVIIGFALAVISIWNRIEAVRYYFTGAKYDLFHGLRCPVMIAPTEEGMITALFQNARDQRGSLYTSGGRSNRGNSRSNKKHPIDCGYK